VTAAGRVGPWRRGLVVALALVAAGTAAAVSSGAGRADAAGRGATALPPAWELCVLEGLGAPVTDADVADLDVWQAAEGGSTNNPASFNPYNTRRDTDALGDVVPASMTSNGFPAFSTWAGGCAATVATIEQANMAPIQAALVGGALSPPAFLATVNTTPWCAPQNGVPCYGGFAADLGSTRTSEAVALVRRAKAAVTAYGQDVAQVADVEATLASERQELAVAEAGVSSAQAVVQTAGNTLRSLAVYDYTSNDSIDPSANLDAFSAPSQRQQLTRYYEQMNTTQEVDAYHRAQAALAAAQAHRDAARAAVGQTTTALAAAQGAVGRALGDVGADVDAFHVAVACTTVPPVVAGGAASVTALSGCLAALHA
jgi:hypothetical protein